MEDLLPLLVAIPLLAAALVAAFGHLHSSRANDVVAIAVAATVTGLSVAVLFGSREAPLTYTFGGWRPRHGLELGIVFSADPLAASLAGLAGILATASLMFAWRYFEDAGALFHVLALTFLAGMVGFVLSNDLFNLFVFFELMSVAAFALTGYRVDQPGPLQGSLNFAITNSVGAIFLLTAIALLYGRTGVLNLDDMGEALGRRPPDGLVVAALVLLLVGFLTKAGAVPFHFWLSDAYAVAPVPVCVLFAGIMSDLGLHGIARVYWTVFADPLAPHADAVRGILVAVAVVTALVGAAMAFLQADMKRMLAFLTVSHIGFVLAGVALLTPLAAAGATVWLVSDGLARGALFLCIGLLIRRLHSSDELTLRGRGRRFPLLGLTVVACALLLARLPPFGTFLGGALVERSAAAVGYAWLAPVLVVASAVSAGAVLRAAARIFLGWGSAESPFLSRQQQTAEQEEPEDTSPRRRRRMGPALALVVVATGLAFAPGIARGAADAAAQVQRAPAPATVAPTLTAWILGGTSVLGAVLVGLLALRPGLPRLLTPAVRGLRAVHSGAVGDYVAWLTVGGAVLAVAFSVALR